jgi:predicted RND superfamily exporter protein
VVGRIVDASGRHPFAVLAIAVLAIVGTWTYAWTTLTLNSDLLELLPRDSPGFQAFEHQLGRVGGGAALIAVVESPDRVANEKFIDQLSAEIAKDKSPDIAYVESGTKEVRQFFDDHKWLYADVNELEDAEREIDHEVGVRTGNVVDLFDDAPAPSPAPSPGVQAPPNEPADALGFSKYKEKLRAKSQKLDLFPTGYFATADGKMMAIRIVSTTRGMGDPASERLLAHMKDVVAKMELGKDLKVGWAGDIPNQVEEKEALLSDAATATGLAFLAILWGIIVFFRSPWSLVVAFLPAFIGVGCAYAFATITYGYVNSTGAFLGAIILGNGINYPIVLLNRYREFRARGMEPEVARREAVINAFRAELVGSLVASIAYGSLAVTHFRGFSQFGVIGFVGMLLVWVSMIPCVPALLVVDEWIQRKLPTFLRDNPIRGEDAARGPIMKRIAAMTSRAPWVFAVLAIAFTVWAAGKARKHVHDPWEYDFAKLGSRGTQQTGAGAWSSKADVVFGGKTNIAGAPILADRPEQVPLIKQAILDNDAKDPQGKLIQGVATVWDFLPGSVEEQKTKLEVLDRIRSHLTPSVLAKLSPEERKTVDELQPPEDLKPIEPKDLPPLIRRRFEENNGVVGTMLYVQPRNDIALSDGHVLLRIAKTTDNLVLADKTVVPTASFWTVYAEIIRSMERDGPLATLTSFAMVALVVIAATRNLRGSVSVLAALVCGVVWQLGVASYMDMRLNFVNFIALPITFGIGCEYPFNIFDRSRLLDGNVRSAVALSGGAVALCSYTTTVGYSSLLFSDQMALQSFGRLAMLGEVSCLVAAILLVPTILRLAMGKRAG